MKKTPFVAAVALALPLWLGPSDAQEDPAALELRIATQAPQGTVWIEALERIANEVRERTKGRVAFQLLTGGVQGDEKAVVDKMKIGLLHGGLFTGIGLGHVLPEVRILELPFFYDSYGDLEQVRRTIEPDITKGFEEKGCVFLGWADVGWAYIFSKDEVRNIEELKRRKIWLWEGDPLAEQTFKSFELSGVPLALPDVLQSLQTGLIDSVYNSSYGLMGLQWHTKVKYMSRMSVGHGTGALVLTKTAWQQVPKKLRPKVQEIARAHLDQLLSDVRKKNEESITELERSGIKVIPIPEAEMPLYRENGERVAQGLAGRLYSKPFLDKVKKVRDEVRAASKKG
jgi:TRAP-type C4-dicarboxylate transport system substrate-binding protein